MAKKQNKVHNRGKYWRYVERKLKENKLPYGMEYLNYVAKVEEKAERMYGNPKIIKTPKH